MSFLKYCVRQVQFHDRVSREPVQIACRYQIFTPQNRKEAALKSMNRGMICNMSTRGLGLVTTPRFSYFYESMLREEAYKIYVEFKHPNSEQWERLIGEIRWIKSISNVRLPFTELGILVSCVENQSKEALLKELFPYSSLN